MYMCHLKFETDAGIYTQIAFIVFFACIMDIMGTRGFFKSLEGFMVVLSLYLGVIIYKAILLWRCSVKKKNVTRTKSEDDGSQLSYYSHIGSNEVLDEDEDKYQEDEGKIRKRVKIMLLFFIPCIIADIILSYGERVLITDMSGQEIILFTAVTFLGYQFSYKLKHLVEQSYYKKMMKKQNK